MTYIYIIVILTVLVAIGFLILSKENWLAPPGGNGCEKDADGCQSISYSPTSGASGIDSVSNASVPSDSVRNISTDDNGNFTTTARLPIGAIIMWPYGESPGSNWALCNGQIANNIQTPDLTGRFILGAGKSDPGSPLIGANSSIISRVHQVGEYDGEEWHKLSKDEIPSHTHTINNVAQVLSGVSFDQNATKPSNVGDVNKPPSMQTSSTGGDGYHNNMPPFYGLYFYMKISDY